MCIRSCRCVSLVAVLTFAASCASNPSDFSELPSELREAAVVARLEPGASVPETATYSWMQGSFVRVDSRYDEAEVERDVCAAVEDALQRRGYHRVPAAAGTLLVGYAIAVEGALDGAQLDSVYMLSQPRDATMRHERGALVLDIVDRQTRRPLWRGSVAILADPTLPIEVRRQRVQHGVEALLDRFKEGY